MHLSGTTAALNVEVSGSGDVDAKGLQVGRALVRSRGPGSVYLNKVNEALEADLNGSGDLSAMLECKSVKLNIGGPGDVRLDGRTATLSAMLNGSGNLSARQLWTGQASVTVRGPGTAVVNLKEQGSDHARLVTYERTGMRERAAN
jgi:hypothetical protein